MAELSRKNLKIVELFPGKVGLNGNESDKFAMNVANYLLCRSDFAPKIDYQEPDAGIWEKAKNLIQPLLITGLKVHPYLVFHKTDSGEFARARDLLVEEVIPDLCPGIYGKKEKGFIPCNRNEALRVLRNPSQNKKFLDCLVGKLNSAVLDEDAVGSARTLLRIYRTPEMMQIAAPKLLQTCLDLSRDNVRYRR